MRDETTITSAIEAVNDIVDEQATLISRIARALDGKAGESSGAGITYQYNQIPIPIKNFLDNVTYDPTDTTASLVESYFDGYMHDKPLGKTIAVDAGTIDVSDEHSSVIGTTVESGNATIFNICPSVGNVVNIVDDDIVKSYRLEPQGSLRMINCPSCHNIRDLGGWSCNGGMVKYGLLFRGGQPASADIPVLVDYLGIRHEINLRGRTEAEEDELADSPLGIRNHLYDAYAWYDLSNTSLWTQMLTDVFDAIKYDDPVLFHCSAGADRTGTMAVVLLGLLGVSRSDIDKDYEITSFYTSFVSYHPSSRKRTGEYQSLMGDINRYGGATFEAKLVTFVKSLGFTSDDINEFRRHMIDGNPSTV